MVTIDLAQQSADRNTLVARDTAQALPKCFFERDAGRMPTDDDGMLAQTARVRADGLARADHLLGADPLGELCLVS